VLFDRYHRLVFDVAVRIVRDPGRGPKTSFRLSFSTFFRANGEILTSRKGILKVWLLQFAYHRALHTGSDILSRTTSIVGRTWKLAIEHGSRRTPWGEVPESVRLAEQILQNLKPRQRAVVEMTYYERADRGGNRSSSFVSLRNAVRQSSATRRSGSARSILEMSMRSDYKIVGILAQGFGLVDIAVFEEMCSLAITGQLGGAQMCELDEPHRGM